MLKKLQRIVIGTIVLIIVPITINYFTGYISLNDLRNNQILTGLIISITINLVLGFILIENEIQKRKLSTRDIEIANELINTLDLKNTEYILKDITHNPGFQYSLINPIDEFLSKSDNQKYYFKDNNLQKKFDAFKKKLHNYRLETAKCMINENGFFKIPIDLKEKNPELFYERDKNLNELADGCYEELTNLMKFLRKKDILK